MTASISVVDGINEREIVVVCVVVRDNENTTRNEHPTTFDMRWDSGQVWEFKTQKHIIYHTYLNDWSVRREASKWVE